MESASSRSHRRCSRHFSAKGGGRGAMEAQLPKGRNVFENKTGESWQRYSGGGRRRSPFRLRGFRLSGDRRRHPLADRGDLEIPHGLPQPPENQGAGVAWLPGFVIVRPGAGAPWQSRMEPRDRHGRLIGLPRDDLLSKHVPIGKLNLATKETGTANRSKSRMRVGRNVAVRVIPRRENPLPRSKGFSILG